MSNQAARVVARFVSASVPKDVFMHLKVGDKVRIEAKGLARPRIVTIETAPKRMDSGAWLVTTSSGKPWSSDRVRGGGLTFREEPFYGDQPNEVSYQPTLMQRPMVVKSLTVQEGASSLPE